MRLPVKTQRLEPPNELRGACNARQLRLVSLLLACLLSMSMTIKTSRWNMDLVADLFDADEGFFFSPSSSTNQQQQQQQQGTIEPIMLELTPPCEGKSSSCNLPQWMKDYFQWHRQTLQNITQPSDWLEHQLLVLGCMAHNVCGGTADRLRPLPYYLALAARAKRLFFIRWTKPLPLEAILEPYQLNWAMPTTLAQMIDQGNGTIHRERNLANMAKHSLRSELWTLQVLSQTMTYVAEYTKVVTDLEDVTKGGLSFQPDYFHDLFLALFQPVPALRDMIETTMTSLHLVPNEFVVTHIRALYPGHPYDTSRKVSDLEPSVWNAVDCASYTFPGAPVFVISDTMASKLVAQAYGHRRHSQSQTHGKNESNQYNYPVVVSDLDMVANSTNSTMVDPLHLDFTQVAEHDPSEYFGIFADLFIMSQSRCVAYGGGGFGRFGSQASFNSTCRAQHTGQNGGRIFKCHPPAF